jgi:Xaa-Pro aminopeptidase
LLVDFLKGDIDEILAVGAHALYFPHGLGHLMGLDVHDMESLGEEYSGYDEKTVRSDLFGFSQLRYGKELQAGLILTVEPGLYFIPSLVEKWRSERRYERFINYDKAEKLQSFGGIRIEDDILVTQTGCRILGRPIPKKMDEIEGMRDF